MSLFTKRTTIVQNIAYMAIMAAINVIFVLLTAILPPLMFLIIFVLPLTSTIVTLFCKKRYFPIYFVVTTALCLIVTSGIYIFDTFFYVIPSMITGFLFGLLIEKKVPAIYVITICSLLQYILTFLTFIILNSIVTEINFIDALLSIFGLSNFAFKDVFTHIFLYALASIQTLFTYLFLKLQIKKLGFEFNLEIKYGFVPLIVTVTSIILAIVFAFFYVPVTFISLMFALPLIIYQLLDLLTERNKVILILLLISLIISVVIFVAFYMYLPHPNAIILISPIYVFISCLYFGNYLFNKKTKVVKINN